MIAQIAILKPYAELPPRTLIRHAIKWQVIGLLLLVCHVVLTKQSLALAWIMPVVLAALYYKAPLAGLIVLFQLLIYQNWVIAMFSVDMQVVSFEILRGTNFAGLFGLAAIASARITLPIWDNERHIHQILRVVALAFVCAIGYWILGTVRSGPQSAAVYFREFFGPVLAVVVGLDVGRVWGFRTIATSLLVCIVASVVVALIEISIPMDYYAWINAADFSNLKTHNTLYRSKLYGAAGVIDMNTSTFFNVSGDSDFSNHSFRFSSTIMHSISYGYVLAITSFLVITLRRSYWLLLTIPLSAAIGVKGAALLVVCVLALWIVWMSSRSAMMLIISGLILMTAYIGAGLIHGMQVQDYHVQGFLGGWQGFLQNPLGRGLGVGGNLSSTAATGFHWEGAGGFQSAGVAFAVESAVGVLLYQMGIGALTIFAVFMVLVKNAPFLKSLRIRPQRSDLWYIAVPMVMVNGVFQEEAYAPTAAGLILLLCAVLIINGQRKGVVLTAQAKQLMRQQRRVPLTPKPKMALEV